MKKENEKPKKKWNYLYKEHIRKDFENWDQYYYVKMKLKKRFLKQVIKCSRDGKPILECGCGTGKTTMFLSFIGIECYAIDLEKEMVDSAKKRFKKYGCKSKIIQGDIKKMPFDNKFFSVTHSSGVLEHYSDEEIIIMINEQLRVSDYCIFSIPTSYFEKKMLGNERFLSRKKWREIINKSNGMIIKETGYHYKTLKNRIFDILRKPKRMFKPIAMFTFVLKEKEE